MQINSAIVSAGCGATQLRSAQWVAPLQAASDKYSINTPLRVAAFLATFGVESGGLSALVENLNYSADGLAETWPTRFAVNLTVTPKRPNDLANHLAHNQQAIANTVYANRNGNGDVASGDGWNFRGRGMGITGRRNYLLCGIGIDLDLIAHPELLEQPGDAAMSAAWYWANRNLNALADAGNFLGVSRAVNLGSATSTATPNGWPQRQALYASAKTALGV
ncbi:glycoside hydrolase family 19 protein [Burkholderia sp. PU8-34]